MTKTIDTLVEDIYALFNNDFKSDELHASSFGKRLAETIHRRINEQRIPKYGIESLRLSMVGTECKRKVWYLGNRPDRAEALSNSTKIKFLFGDILEELLLFLAEEAGHSVEGRQTPITINGVTGHRDAIIDGRLVDVKSASTLSFKKFEANDLRGKDSFGYLDQLGSYHYGSRGEELLKDKDVASFLVIDKTLGNICLDTYPVPDIDYNKKIEELKEVVTQKEPPRQHYMPVPEGKSGNMKLGTECSYCAFKHECWPELRTFLYAAKPIFLTKVVKEPRVPEVDKDGNLIEKELIDKDTEE